MPFAADVLQHARTMLAKRTVYWAGAGGLLPQAATPASALRIAGEWPKLTPEEQAAYRPLAEQAGIDVNDPDAVVQACDCTGFLLWSLGISRKAPERAAYTQPDGWINTDSIWADATRTGILFRRIDRAVPGCVVVYPKAGSGENYGHDGLVTAVDALGIATQVIHCSATNFKGAPFDAIKETTPDAFLRQPATVYATFAGLLG
jgi:hypothetical protein